MSNISPIYVGGLELRIKELEYLLGKWVCHDGHVCPSCGMPSDHMQELEAELAESNSINQRQAALIVKIESCRQRERDALLPISRLRNELQLTEEMVANAKQALKGG